MGKIYVEKNMPKKKRKLHRAVGILLAVAVTCQAMPFDGITVFAAEEVQSAEAAAACTHEHTEDCYKVIEDCIHEHEESCYPEATTSEEGETFTEEENKQPTECRHSCSEESGCITKELDCRHDHNASCGYTQETSSEEETTESPSTFVGEIYNDETTEDTAVNNDAAAPMDSRAGQQASNEASVTIDGEVSYYATAEEAFAAANGQTAEVALLKDAEVERICLNAGDITYRGGSYTLRITAGSSSNKDSICLEGNASMTIEDGTIAGTKYAVVVNSRQCSLAINGGSITGEYGVTIYFGSMEITGGSVTGTDKALYIQGGATQISGGYFQGDRTGLSMSNYGGTPKLELSGGTFYGKLDTQSGISIVTWTPSVTAESLLAEGCTYHDPKTGETLVIRGYRIERPVEVCPHIHSFPSWTPNEDNRTHSRKCGSCDKTETERHTYEDGKCSVCGGEIKMVAKVGEEDYWDIGRAVSDAQAKSAVLTLLEDVTDRIDFTSGAVTLRLNGHNVTNSATAIQVRGGSLTIEGEGRVEGIWLPYGTLRINGGEYSGLTGAVNVEDLNNTGNSCSLEIRGGVFHSGREDRGAVRITNEIADCKIYGGQFTGGEGLKGLYIKENTSKVKLYGGNFCAIDYPGDLSTLLPLDACYIDAEGNVVDTTGLHTIKNVRVRSKAILDSVKVCGEDGQQEKNTFSVDENIIVKATPRAQGTVLQRTAFTEPASDQMALFAGGEQVSESVNADGDGCYTMTAKAADVLALSGAAPGDRIALTARFAGNDDMAGAECTVSVQILAAVKVETDGSIFYYGTIESAWNEVRKQDKTAKVLLLSNVTASAPLEVSRGDHIIFEGGSYTVSSDNGSVFCVNGGVLDIGSGTIKGTISAIEIKNGTIQSLLRPGYAYFKDGTTPVVEGLDGGTLPGGTYTVKICGHSVMSYTQLDQNQHKGSCPACGFEKEAEAHDFNNGGICTKCGLRAEAKLKINGTASYYGSIHAAWEKAAAESSPAIELCKDVETDTTLEVPAGIELTLDCGAFTLTGKDVGAVTVSNGGTLNFTGGTVRSTGSNNCISADSGSNIIIKDGNFIGDVYIASAAAVLSGGTYSRIAAGPGSKLSGFPASGYTYYSNGSNQVIKLADIDAQSYRDNVTIKECPHPSAADAAGKCEYCGTDILAEVTIDGTTRYYTDIDKAWDTVRGKTAAIKLLKSINREACDGEALFLKSGNVTLDMAEGVILSNGEIGGWIIKVGGGELTLNSGTIQQNGNENTGIIIMDGILRIAGGTVEAGMGVYVAGGRTIITGGTFTGTDEDGVGLMRENGTVEISGGTFSGGFCAVNVNGEAEGGTIASLLADGFAFKQDGSWVNDADTKDRVTGTVTVHAVPVKITRQPVDTAGEYGSNASLSIETDKTSGITYQWYEVKKDGSETEIKAGDNSGILTPSAKARLDVGTYRYYCKASKDGYAVKSSTVTFSVTPRALTASLTGSTIKAYDGTADCSGDGLTLSLPEAYSDDDVAAEAGSCSYDTAEAGEHKTVTVNGITLTGAKAGNYTLSKTSVSARVGKITKAEGTLTVPEEPVSKKFGDAAFLLKCLTNGDGRISYASSNPNVISVSTDGNVSIKGAGTAEITVSLAEGTNHTGGARKTVDINVAKKDGYTVEEVNRRYLYSRENTGTVDLAVLLPDDCGETIYHTPSTSGALTYKTEPAVTKNGILSYTLNRGSKDAEGTITVTVATRNYEDITITVKIKLTDKIPVNLKDGTKVTLKNDVLTYGEPLSKLLFNEAEFIGDDGETVEGTLAWKDQTAKPDAGTPSAVWVFTPEDDTYSALEDAVSIKVNKAVPRITTAPAAVKRIYSPSKPLEKAELTGGEAAGVDGRALSGTWDWCREDIIPNAGANSYQAVFTPENAANYESAEAAVTVDVEKAVPYLDLKQLPSASAITYGDSLVMSSLTGGSAQYGDGMGNPGTGTDSKLTVAGTFTWKEQNVKPAVADSNQTEYAVIFTPEDTKNFNTAETVVTLTVNKAQDAPNMPQTEMNVSNSIEKVSDVPLPEGWAWQDSDRDTALEPDTTVTAEAVYIGADKGNYINESVTVVITRSSCEHTAGEILYTGSGEKLPTCTEAGIGHRECTKCHAVIESGITLPATGHDYNEGEVTKGPTEASEGEKTYTCSRCGDTYTESIPKKIPKGLWIDNLEPSIPYTGSAIKQEAIRVYYGDTLLREKTDYTISYKNNTNAGTAQIIVTGKGNYTGKAVKDFMIEPVDISRDSNLSAMVTTAVETGKKLKPAVTVTWNGKPLKEKKDYTLSYDTNIKTAGDYDITVTGNKNYTGVLVRTFHVKQRGTKLLNSVKVTGIKKSYPYTSAYQGSALESDLKNMIVKMGKITLTRDIDYTVRTENTTAAGTAVIILEAAPASLYAGEKRITTAITGTDLRKGSVKINSAEKAFSYTGAPVTPQITVYSGKNGSGSIVPAGAYTVSYSSNIDKGKATVTATGIPEKGCSGSVQCTFQIGTLNLETERAAGNIKITMPADISHAKGGAVPQPVITHTYHQTTRTLREGADYALKYSGNMTAGGAKTPTVKITGIGNYSGSITETYVISAQGISRLSVTVTDRAYRKNKKGSDYYSAPKVYDLDGKQLKAGKDYTVAYTYADSGKPIGKNDKIPVGTKLCATVTAAKNSSYTGTQSAAYFVREAKEVKNIAKAKIDKIAPQQYTGSAVTPEIRLYEKTGKTKNYLTSKDYEIIGCYNNTKRGTASILVRGKGAYSGVKRITFKIVQKKIK